jgi:hypothetical protein
VTLASEIWLGTVLGLAIINQLGYNAIYFEINKAVDNNDYLRNMFNF